MPYAPTKMEATGIHYNTILHIAKTAGNVRTRHEPEQNIEYTVLILVGTFS
jgi:hypothetical protein